MLMICSKVISNSPKGFQQSLDGIYKHAQEWKLKVIIPKNLISSYLAVIDIWLLSLCKGNS